MAVTMQLVLCGRIFAALNFHMQFSALQGKQQYLNSQEQATKLSNRFIEFYHISDKYNTSVSIWLSASNLHLDI